MPSMTKAGYVPPAPQKKKPKKKRVYKRRKKSGLSGAVLISLAIFLLACAVGVGTLMIYAATAPYMNAFLPGTMLLGYPLGGASMEEAQALLEKITAEDVAAFEVSLEWNEQQYLLSAQDIDLTIDAEETLDALWKTGHEGGMLSCFMAMLALRQEPMVVQPIVTYDMTAADELLALIEQDIACAPENAQVKYRPASAEPFVFKKESIGYSLDLAPVRVQIEQAAASVRPERIALEPQIVMPDVTLEDLEANIVMRSRIRMEIDAQEAAFDNVTLAAKALDGVCIEPTATLSFNKTVGARSAVRGYKEAAEPAYGEDVSGVGGGICQLSTAMYRLALLAGLNAAERSAAVRPVDYCEMGQEAAVSDQGIDLKIENTTAYPVFVSARTYREEKKAILEISLLGEPIQGTYELVTGILEEKWIEEPVYVRDHEGKYAKYDDERVEAGEPKPGYTVVVERVKRGEEGKEISRETISNETYVPVPPAIYVGVQNRD